MNKNQDSNNSSETLLRALSEPISEVDTMSPNQVRSYLTENGMDRTQLRAALSKRLQTVAERVAATEARKDLVTRFDKVRPSLESAVGASRAVLNRKFVGLLSSSPQRASQLLVDLEQADEIGLKELYAALEQWAGD